RGGIVDRVCRPVKSKPPDRTTHKNVARFPSFVVGRCPTDPEIDSGGKIVAAPTLTKAKTRHKQVSSRDNPGPSALAQKHDEVAPRVGRYLAGGDPPPSRHSSMRGCSGNRGPTSRASTEMHMPGASELSLRTLASTCDGGPEDAPEELGTHSPRPRGRDDPDATRRVRGGHSDLFKKYRLKGRWVAKGDPREKQKRGRMNK
ncbi:hypothetical protein GW17_00056618, partial [Ensete ventricosum]